MWLNLTDQFTEGLWESKQYSEPCQYWKPGEPNDTDNEDCAEMQADGTWNDQGCSSSRRMACRKNGAECVPFTCPDDLWKLSSKSTTWSSAMSGCPSGYSPAVPRDFMENYMLQTTANGQKVWMNLTDAASEGLWKSQ